jgi:hypothetical protein
MLPEVVIEQYGTSEDYQRTVRPAFDALWNAAGFSASKHFDADGRWVGTGEKEDSSARARHDA